MCSEFRICNYMLCMTQIEKQLPVLSLCESKRLLGTSFLNDLVRNVETFDFVPTACI